MKLSRKEQVQLSGLLDMHRKYCKSRQIDCSLLEIGWVKKYIIQAFHLSVESLQRLVFFKLMNTNDPKYCIDRIPQNPFEFVMMPEQIMRYSQAKEGFSDAVQVDPIHVHRSWVYDTLLFNEGKLYMPKNQLRSLFVKEFGDVSGFEEAVETVIFDHKEFVTLDVFKSDELEAGDRLIEQFLETDAPPCEEECRLIRDRLTTHANENGLMLTSTQSDAVVHAMTRKLTLLCGHPGTGKTTIVDCLLRELRAQGTEAAILAPTGMAVKNVQDRCGSHSKVWFGTMHKMLLMTNTPDFEPKYIVVDEFSMVNFYMFRHLLSWCERYNARLLLIADVNQLPPIGAGCPLHALISCNMFRVFWLRKIMRQSKGNLKKGIFKMSKGESVLLGDFDQRTLCFEPTNTFDRKTVSEIVRRYAFDISTSRFVTPQHKHAEGTMAMNHLLQEIFLPENSTPLYPSFKVTGNLIHVNDLVVRIKNDYSPESSQAMHVNGDVGYVRQKNNTLGVYLVEYENGTVETVYLDDLYKEFSLAYCLTVHKVQGSQYLDVVVLMGNNHEFSWGENNPDARSLLYTAMSRAKRRCIMVGNPTLFKMAQRSSRSSAPKRSLFMKEFKDYEI